MNTKWYIKQRPAGDFAVQRWDRATQSLIRWGIYQSRQLAEDILTNLRYTQPQHSDALSPVSRVSRATPICA